MEFEPLTDTVQLTLALNGPPDFSRDAFLLGTSNNQALSLVESWPEWPAPVLVLVGPRGAGKSHLASIWAQNAGADSVDQNDAMNLTELTGNLVIDAISGSCLPERPLFHLINGAQESGNSLLLVSREDPTHWVVELPDLQSRLRQASLAKLEAPDDALLGQVLVKLFADRQLIVDPHVIDYVLLRMERSFSAALDLVRSIDERALSEGRRVTRALASKVLGG